jgi:hypothetical protein
MPSPALIDLLESYQDTLLHPFEIDIEDEEDSSDAGKTRKRKRALVPVRLCYSSTKHLYLSFFLFFFLAL